MRHHGSTVAFILLMIAIVIFSFTMTSCHSKSGHLADVKPEKVVILDSYPQTVKSDGISFSFKYKVKRIEHGVVAVIYDQNLYEKGDTIYKRISGY